MLTLPHNCEWKVSAPLLVSTSYILRWSDAHVSIAPKLKAKSKNFRLENLCFSLVKIYP